MGRFQSGQMGRAVNPLASAFGGSNPPLPTFYVCGSDSVARVVAFQATCRGFESRLPLECPRSSVVERILGKDEVISSTLIEGFYFGVVNLLFYIIWR
jgi:hypothetical protein